MRSIAVIGFTRAGCELARHLSRRLAAGGPPGASEPTTCSASGPARFADELGIEPYGSLASWTQAHFAADDALVFVGAAGIAVRAVAPFVRDKFSDPAVVSVDEAGRFAVPLLSGHVGGANELARTVAQITGGQAVVSTATDVNGLFAVDEWAARHGLAIAERAVAKEVSAALLEGRPVGFWNACGFDLAGDAPRGVVEGPADIGFVVALGEDERPYPRTLHLVPRVVTVGVGCRRGIAVEALRQAVFEALSQAHVSPRAVAALASIDVKADEPAIRALADERGWSLAFYTADELAAVPGAFSSSEFVERTVGVGNVCERAACAGGGALLAGRRAAQGATVALAAALPLSTTAGEGARGEGAAVRAVAPDSAPGQPEGER